MFKQYMTTELFTTHVCRHLDVTHLCLLCRVSSWHIWKIAFDEKQAQLRNLLTNGDLTEPGSRICWIGPPSNQCGGCDFKEACGDLVRFMLTNHNVLCFSSVDELRRFNPDRHGTYLMHSEETKIKWVRKGKNAGGGWLDGCHIESSITEHWLDDSDETYDSDEEVDEEVDEAEEVEEAE